MKLNYLVFSLSLLHMSESEVELLSTQYLQFIFTLSFSVMFSPAAGKMKGLAFIQDPDGYWIEILSPNNMVSITS